MAHSKAAVTHSDQAVENTPIAYLRAHNKRHGINLGAEWDEKLSWGENWWNGVGVSRRPEDTPMCSTCQEDTKLYECLKKEMTLGQFMEKRMKCCRWCLWFGWFHQLRLKASETLKK
jgi:hypothetical protein